MGRHFYWKISKMKTIAICLLFVASATADVYLSANQVFCNCGDAENNFYANFMAAENSCAAGDGHGSCMAIKLGFLSEDCRTQFPGANPYAAAGSAYTNFLACLKALYIGTCQQRAL